MWLTVPEPQNHKFLRWIRVVDSSWTLKSQIPAMNLCGWQMVGPSVFPDTQVIPKWLVLQYFQKSRLYQNGGSFSISRKAGYIRMAGFLVFPDSRVEKSSFETQNWLFKIDFKSETTSKYILDIPWVFPAHFPYIKHLFSRKIGQNHQKPRKIDIFI